MRRNLQSLRSVLVPLCSEIGLSERLRLESLRTSWRSIVGHPLSDHTYPMSIERGSLLVNVDSPLWLQELRFSKTVFQRKLSGLAITDVRFRHGRTYWSTTAGDACAGHASPGNVRTHVHKCSEQESLWINELTGRLRDQDLRDIINRVIEKTLTRQAAQKLIE